MPKILEETEKQLGTVPGTILYHGAKKTSKVKIQIIDYTGKTFVEKKVKDVKECFAFKKKDTVTWINITGIHDTYLVKQIGELFDIHDLVLEDIVNPNQRPKIEDYEAYLFVVLQMVYGTKKVETEQVSLIISDSFVISFQEKDGDVFDHVRERIRKAKGRIKRKKNDYLAYALMDAIVDHYFVVLEKIGDKVESMERKVVDEANSETLTQIRKIKRDLIFMRKSTWPLREVISFLLRGESKIFKKDTTPYLRDLYDHTIQVIDTVETLRDMASGLLDIYMTSVSNRMNEVMKVLTIIATIFIPLTFVAGIYGMNFTHMPELDTTWAYPVVWIIMVAIAITMLIYFKKKKWL